LYPTKNLLICLHNIINPPCIATVVAPAGISASAKALIIGALIASFIDLIIIYPVNISACVGGFAEGIFEATISVLLISVKILIVFCV
jgi:hypothetical protein